MDRDTLVLVDYSNLFYRAANVHRDLSYKGKHTGALYGFIKGLANVVNQTNASRVALCLDMKPYQRSLDFSDYKANRATTDTDRQSEIKNSLNAVDEFLALICCHAIGAPAFEADDVMAILSARHDYEYQSIVLASNDSDLYQLLDQNNVTIFLGKKGYFDRRKFFNLYPTLTKCKQWVEVSALAGSHNDTPGISGIGVKTAVKIVSDAAVRSKYQQKLDAHKLMLRRNKHLCKLPYPPLKPRFNEIAMKRPGAFAKYDERGVIRFLARYGIKLTKTMANAFETIARGNDAI